MYAQLQLSPGQPEGWGKLELKKGSDLNTS